MVYSGEIDIVPDLGRITQALSQTHLVTTSPHAAMVWAYLLIKGKLIPASNAHLPANCENDVILAMGITIGQKHLTVHQH